jgi:hypothetical protein
VGNPGEVKKYVKVGISKRIEKLWGIPPEVKKM